MTTTGMNDAESTSVSIGKKAGTLIQALGILAAAVCLGLAYNRLSPVGVEFTSTPEAGTAVSPKATPVWTGYVNETLAMEWETAEPKPTTASSVMPLSDNHLAQPAIAELTWAQVKPLLAAKKIVLLDARTAANYATSHIPGALSLPSTADEADLAAFMANHAKDAPMVVYCGSRSCHMSHQIAVKFTAKGFTNVRTMPGGYAEYLAAEPKQASPAKP